GKWNGAGAWKLRAFERRECGRFIKRRRERERVADLGPRKQRHAHPTSRRHSSSVRNLAVAVVKACGIDVKLKRLLRGLASIWQVILDFIQATTSPLTKPINDIDLVPI